LKPAIKLENKGADMSKKNGAADLVVKDANEVVISQVATNLEDWGTADVSSNDVIIPKILCMQATSELVAEGKARMGDFVDSVTHEVLGSVDNPIKFVPFHMEKVWIVSEKKVGASRFEFKKYLDVTADTMGLPWEEAQADGSIIKNEYALQFFCLRPEDTSMPYVVTFKSTSLRAGKVVSTQMYVRNRAAGLVPPAYTMLLSGKKEKNDQGTFIVMDAKPAGKTSDEVIGECLTWLKVVKSGKAKVAEESIENEYKEEQTKF
jgi:hypothetical protein